MLKSRGESSCGAHGIEFFHPCFDEIDDLTFEVNAADSLVPHQGQEAPQQLSLSRRPDPPPGIRSTTSNEENSMTPTTASVPPTNEPTATMVNVAPPRPFLAS